jgi:hypothetical protein
MRIAWPQHSTVHRDRPHLGYVLRSIHEIAGATKAKTYLLRPLSFPTKKDHLIRSSSEQADSPRSNGELIIAASAAAMMVPLVRRRSRHI